MQNTENNQSKVYLDNILKRMPGSVYWKDSNGIYLGCNQLQAQMAGFDSPEEMIGKTDDQLPWKDIADKLREIDQRIMKTGLPEEAIETPVLSNGNKLVMLTNKAPLYDEEGHIIGIIGTSLDMTALKEAQDRERAAFESAAIAEEARKTIMVLAGSIAHDLRSPLFSLGILTKSLEKLLAELPKECSSSSLGSPGSKLNPLTRIQSIPDKIKKIVQDMNSFIDINLKSLKSSALHPLKEENLIICKSYKAFNNALDSYPFAAGERDLIHLDTRYYFDFMGNPILFLRVMFNLINNALYQIHTNQKGQIFISSEEHADVNIIRFKDTGGGASPEVISHIFDGYQSTKDNGTGVGLAFCKLTMRNFGGDITCHSVEGDYIEFVLSFPKLA